MIKKIINKEDELLNLLTKKPEPVCYDGFEPSGRMHIAQVSKSQFSIFFNIHIMYLY